MKIFIVHENPYKAGNPYIYTLMDEMTLCHPEIEWGWGMDVFWSDKLYSYDILHFHWPQAFMASDAGEHTMEDLAERVRVAKCHGIKIISTCHDLEPHYSQCEHFAYSFHIVYSQSDIIIHLGQYSQRIMHNIYPSAMHVVIPHHLYDTVYTCRPTREKALRRLGLRKDFRYILCLGMFRAEEERQLVLKAAKTIGVNKVRFLAPSFMPVMRGFHHVIIPYRSHIKELYYKYRYGILMTGKTWVPVSDELIPYYYAVSDLAFVHRCKILNSGNAVLPMLFQKTIVGPNVANVGELLSKWNYPTFDVDKIDSVGEILRLALLNEGTFNSSRKCMEQLSEYSTKVISEKLYVCYLNCLR